MTRLLLAPWRLAPTLTRSRFLLGQLAWRAFTSRHAGSYLGWMWTPVSTAVQFCLYVLVFSVIMDIKAEGLGIDLAKRPDVGFGVFLVTGLVPFLAVNDAVVRAARVFRAHTSLVQRVRLPLETLVIGDMAGALLHHGVSLAMVIAYCLVAGHLALAGLGWLVLGIALCALWVVGLSLIASVLGAALPDVPEVLTLVLQIAFYGAPIVYPLALVESGWLKTVIEANPVTGLVGVMRAGLIAATPPPLWSLVLLAVGGVALVAVGAAVLDRFRANIPDLL